jgi:hypothetical protein
MSYAPIQQSKVGLSSAIFSRFQLSSQLSSATTTDYITIAASLQTVNCLENEQKKKI